LEYTATETYTATQYFLSDLFMFRVLSWPTYANPVAWSLYVEVAFYVALPVVVMVLRPRRMLAFCIVALVVMHLADHTSRDYSIWRYFVYGILAACLTRHLRNVALPLFGLGAALLALDLCGPYYDWAAYIVGHRHLDGHTIGIGIACTLMLATLPHLSGIGRALDVFPLRLVGLISYSLYVTHLFFISANFPVLGPFAGYGSQANHQLLLALAKMPVWYLPLVFFPGMLAWALVSYLLVERPGIALGRYLVGRRERLGAAAQPAE
jgi:peptidoglycan/LPS O-acetylase OafA/YrhL